MEIKSILHHEERYNKEFKNYKKHIIFTRDASSKKSVTFSKKVYLTQFCQNNEPSFPRHKTWREIPMMEKGRKRGKFRKQPTLETQPLKQVYEQLWLYHQPKEIELEPETTIYAQLAKNQRKAYRIEPLTATSNENQFDGLENDALEGYGDYNTPWKLDSGASDNYAGKQTYIKNRKKVKNGVRVGVANGESMEQVEAGTLPFDVPAAASNVHVFENMPRPLIGCGKLVKAGCKIVLDAPEAQVIDKATNKVIMTGRFDPWSSTWDVYPNGQPTGTTTPIAADMVYMSFAGNAYRLETKKEIVSFYHAAAGFPVKKTWLAAIKRGAYASWPGLTEELVRKHYEKSEPTVMGHMHARRSGQRSTKPKKKSDEEVDEDLLDTENQQLEPPRPGVLQDKQRRVGVHVIVFDELNGTIATDLCGRFPHMSNRGMKYILILYDYDTNAILAEPMKSREGQEIVRAYDILYTILIEAGVTPILQYLDNEVSSLLIASIKEKKLKYQLASPHDHRLNPAERAVQTFKNHYIAILHGSDERFPKYLWCRILPQAVMTLNMLRKSRINPKLSAHDQLFGTFNYNRTPLAPLGTKVIIHERPEQRASWGGHGKAGWFTGPAMNHYRHYEVHVTDTGGTRVSDTIEFFPTKCSMPKTSSDDRIVAALEEISEAVANQSPRAPFLSGNKTNEIVKELSEIFQTKEPVTTTKPIVQSPRVAKQKHKRIEPIPVTPPRVTKQKQKRIEPIPVTPPRVTKTPEKAVQHQIGTIIYKQFGREIHRGHITSYDTTRRYYRIAYEDDDEEEMTHDEVTLHRSKPKRMDSATRHQQVEKEYWSAINSGRRRSDRIEKIQTNFTGGYANAAEHLQSNWYHRKDWIPQEYKIYANSVIDETTGKKMEYRDLIKHPKFKDDWLVSGSNEFGRLFQGIGKNADGTQRVVGTNTCVWINRSQVPKHKKVTYARIVVDVRPEKAEPNRTRITAGGDKLDYFGDVSTETASLETAKILFNSIVSTPGAKFMTMDISNMYLNTPLKDFQYMRFHIDVIPEEVIEEYDLRNKVDDKGWVYCEIQRAIYGLRESGKLSNIQLQKVLAKSGYHPCSFTQGLYKHETRPIAFSLVVDDFGVKYTRKEDAEHLLQALTDHYPMKSDWEGEYYLGITLKWDYNKVHKNRNVKLSMPGYVKEALLQFQHEKTKDTYAPSPYTEPIYGRKQQMAPIIEAPIFTKKEEKLLQQICGKFLYYARAIDNTMMHALNDLASQITTGTMKTKEAVACFLNYCATYPDTEIMYRASDMVIKNDSDAAYLVAPKARSRAGGYTYMGNNDENEQIINAPIMIIAKILKMVVASAAEAEIAALFLNAQEIVPLRMTCEELGHPQPPTPLRTDNSTANGILNGTVKQKRSKAIDMRFYWLKDRVTQRMFKVYWAPGKVNLADYYTKHHPASHVKRIRPIYTHGPDSPSSLQGCVKILQ